MFFRRTFLVAAIVAASATAAAADTYLGSYVARISGHDHEASDGYPLESAAQIVRQDRANYHKFGRIDAEDTGDSWFASAKARGRLQNMLERGGAGRGDGFAHPSGDRQRLAADRGRGLPAQRQGVSAALISCRAGVGHLTHDGHKMFV